VKEDRKALVPVNVNVAEAVAAGGRVVTFKTAHDPSKALQVRKGSDRLELGELDDSCNQQWLQIGEQLQHVDTGLFLDTEVAHVYYQRGEPWESCGTELYVRPRDGSDRQRWCFDARSKLGDHCPTVALSDPPSETPKPLGRYRLRSVHLSGQGSADKFVQISKSDCDGFKLRCFAASLGNPRMDAQDEECSLFDLEQFGEYIRIRSSQYPDKYLMASDALIDNGWQHQVFLATLDSPCFKLPGTVKCLWQLEGSGAHVRLRHGVYTDTHLQVSEFDYAGFQGGHWKHHMFCGPQAHPYIHAPGTQKRLFELVPVEVQSDVNLQALYSAPLAVAARSSSCFIRHVMDGRAVDVNFWDLQNGQGVNANVPHSDGKGVSWIVEEVEVPAQQKGLSTISRKDPELTRTPILDLPAGAVFLIQPAANKEYCLSVRSGGYTKDAHEVFLAKVDGSANQKWRLIGDQFQHVSTGRYLDSETKYPFLWNLNCPWEGNNHSHLVTRERNSSDSQRWVVGPEEFHGGKVLRHFKDGRGVDVHHWQFKEGGNVGCENSVHGDCKGLTYVFTVVDGAANGKAANGKTVAPRGVSSCLCGVGVLAVMKTWCK
jgi:hypothetical protein